MDGSLDGHIISDMELDHILRALKPSDLEDIGGKTWIQQMSMLEELNVQAALEARDGLEERVRDSLVEHDKLGLVVRDMILVEIWREEIMPRILREGQPESSFQLYMVLFNEANLCNLLETILFHGSTCQSLDERAIDLADYCMRQIHWLLSRDPNQEPSDLGQLHSTETTLDTPLVELERHNNVIRFQVGLKCLTILRYLTDNLEDLPLGVSTRMVITHDVPISLVSILEEEPWKRQRSDCEETFDGHQWRPNNEVQGIHKTEAQAWLALFNLLSRPITNQKYEIHDYRKAALLRLLGILSRPTPMELPFNESFRKWLLQLQLGSVPSAKPGLLIETIAEIKEGLMSRYRDKFDEIARDQSHIFLKNNQELFDEEITKLIHTFENTSVQKLLRDDSTPPDKKACVVCQSTPAKNRCSRCHSERYCSRKCQLKHWPKHKGICSQRMTDYQSKNEGAMAKIEEILAT